MAKDVKEFGLSDTVEMMNSDDYKERFRAEYFQLKIRYEKLHAMLIKYEAGTLNFKPKCPIYVLENQANAMREYLHWMEVRLEIEFI